MPSDRVAFDIEDARADAHRQADVRARQPAPIFADFSYTLGLAPRRAIVKGHFAGMRVAFLQRSVKSAAATGILNNKTRQPVSPPCHPDGVGFHLLTRKTKTSVCGVENQWRIEFACTCFLVLHVSTCVIHEISVCAARDHPPAFEINTISNQAYVLFHDALRSDPSCNLGLEKV